MEKRRVLECGSAYTSDVGHIDRFGMDNSDTRFKIQYVKPQKSWKEYNYGIKLRTYEDAYTRSTFRDYLKTPESALKAEK